MPIQFNCHACGKLLSVDESYAGKSARCPQCQSICQIPAAQASMNPANPQIEPQYNVTNSAGQTFGPATQSQLETWVAEGRIAAGDMIQQVGMQSQMAASQMFPSLLNVGLSTSYGQPAYGSPTHRPQKQTAKVNRVGPSKNSFKVVTTSFDVIWNNAFSTFKEHWAILMVSLLIPVIPFMVLSFVMNQMIESMVQQGQFLMAGLIYFGFLALMFTVSMYFNCGYAQMSMKLLKGKTASYDLLFSGTNFLTVIGCMIPVWLVSVLPTFVAGIILASMELERPDLVLPIILAINFFSSILASMLWPTFYLALEGRASFPGIYSQALEITVANLGNCILLPFLMAGLYICGLIMCCVGAFPTMTLAILLLPTSYLAMTNQLR